MAAGTTLTRLYSALRLYGQTETADREVTVKEEELQRLLTTHGVILEMSLRRSASAAQMFYLQVTCVTCRRCVCIDIQVVARLQKQHPNQFMATSLCYTCGIKGYVFEMIIIRFILLSIYNSKSSIIYTAAI